MRVLGIDPGGRRMGLAVGDDRPQMVTPLEVIVYQGCDAAAQTISERVARHGADLAVIGLPTTADGDETPACARSHALSDALAALEIATELQPEYLSSNEARRRARTAGRRRSDPIDDLAACVIVEDFFASRNRS